MVEGKQTWAGLLDPQGRAGVEVLGKGQLALLPARELGSAASWLPVRALAQIDFCTIFGLQMTTGGQDFHYSNLFCIVKASHALAYVMTSFMTPV